MNSLIEILKEQASFGFTGKVNFLLKENSQFQGAIFLNDGMLVGAEFKQLKGKKALFKMIFEDVETHEIYKFVIEPEIIAQEHISFKMAFEEARLEAQSIFEKYQEAKKLKPPEHLKLIIDPIIVVSDDSITPNEFIILSLLTEWCKVSDIYIQSKLMEFEVTNALVSLRKKRAIKVFQN